MYVPSTPASRGEADPEVEETRVTVEEVAAQAEALGFKLVPAAAEVEVPVVGQGEEPKGNASTEEWADFAKSKGATDADLVDEKGEPLKRDALKEKYGTPPPAADPHNSTQNQSA